MPTFERTNDLLCVAPAPDHELQLIAVSLKEGKQRTLWKRPVLPVDASISSIATDERRGLMTILYSTRSGAEMRTVGLRDGVPTSEPLRVHWIETDLAFVADKLWLISSHGLSELASSSAQAVHEQMDQEAIHNPVQKVYSQHVRPGTSLMYRAFAEYYRDESSGSLSVCDLSNKDQRRLWWRNEPQTGIPVVASTAKHLLAATESRKAMTFSLRDPKRPILEKRKTMDHVWRRAWGDRTREVFYVVHDDGLQAFRVNADGTLVRLSPLFSIEGTIIRAFADLGDMVAFFTHTGYVRRFVKRPKGFLKELSPIKVSNETSWPVSLPSLKES